MLALALKNNKIKSGDVVSVMLPNVPEMIEAHFGVPMSGAIKFFKYKIRKKKYWVYFET